MIYFVSSKNIAALKRTLGQEKKPTWFELLPQIPAEESGAGNQIYLDITGLTPAEQKKAIGLLKKSGSFWGIIDPKGAAEDPASFFFDGAGDYIGPALVKKGLNKKRFATAFSWTEEKASAGSVSKGANGTEVAGNKKNIKLPGGKFEGWKSIRAGSTGSFFFLFVSISGKTNLRSQIGEASFNIVKNRLRDVLQHNLWEADALLWMETEGNCLFLVPPRAANGKTVIEAVLKMILNCRLIGMEDLGLSFPVEFTFALHFGQTAFQAPGKTGAVISDSVNYIFHLGTKRAETGRLTISEDVPEEVFPDGLKDFFRNTGVFEGIPIRHSRRFIYE